MDYMNAFAISAAGMGVERLRVEVAASNLAHAHAVSEADGDGFRPLRVVVRTATGRASFDAVPFGARVRDAWPGPVATVEPGTQPARRVLEPGHPLADPQGFVRYPGVDSTAEMVTLMSATRAYEANVVAMNAARAMALKALEIGA
jgi:flagellar basal-body rod protein FlgC